MDETKLWSDAENLVDLGELTVRWLKGEITHHPCQLGSPDDETSEIIDDLVDLNRHGFYTTMSQPAFAIDDSGCGKRAFVRGFTEKKVAKAIASLSMCTDLVVFACEPNSDLAELPITSDWFHLHTGIPVYGVSEAVYGIEGNYGRKAERALLDSWAIQILDPKWGRKRYLWDHLRRTVRTRENESWRCERFSSATADAED